MADSSYHWTDNLCIDPYEEERREEKRRSKEMKQMKEKLDMLDFIADAKYGIPTKCPCGGQMKDDVSAQPKYRHDFDTLPGSRYFTCSKYKDDGFHFRQPWVFGVEQEIEKLVRKVDQQSEKIEEMQKEIQSQAQEIARLNMLL